MENRLDYKEEWSGEYRGIRFSIVHWRLGWNYYLYIPKGQLPDNVSFELRAKSYKLSNDSRTRYTYNYSSAPIISDLDWHGGITLYEKQRDKNGKVTGYKMGCDYMHYWDENKCYNIDLVERDVLHSIDKLWELIPNLKLRCSWNGKYYNQDKVYFTDKGVRVALENKEKWEKPIGQEVK